MGKVLPALQVSVHLQSGAYSCTHIAALQGTRWGAVTLAHYNTRMLTRRSASLRSSGPHGSLQLLLENQPSTVCTPAGGLAQQGLAQYWSTSRLMSPFGVSRRAGQASMCRTCLWRLRITFFLSQSRGRTSLCSHRAAASGLQMRCQLLVRQMV